MDIKDFEQFPFMSEYTEEIQEHLPHFVFYRKQERETECYCTFCHQRYIDSPFNRTFQSQECYKHNKYGVCVNCGEFVQFKAMDRGRKTYRHSQNFAVFHAIGDTVMIRCFRAYQYFEAEKLYVHIGYDNFEDYAEQEFSLKRRQAYQYISVYENLGEEFVQSNAQLGITKLSLLTQVDSSDRKEIIEENDLAGMTVGEVKELLEKVKIQGEQLSMFESEKRSAESQASELEEKDKEIYNLKLKLDELNRENISAARMRDKLQKRVEELESRPVEVAVPEPEIREVIKEVPDKEALAEKDRELSALKETLDKTKESYESRIAELQKSSERSEQADKNSFKALYADAYKAFNGVLEFIKLSENPDRDLYIERTEKLLDAVTESLHRLE